MNERSRQYGLVTGAASGLGRALSHRLARSGYELVLTDVNREDLSQVTAEIQKWSPGSFERPLDVRDPGAWSEMRSELESRWGRLDLLVNCAGTLAIGDALAIPPDQAKKVIDVNLLGVIYGCQTCGQLLLDNRRSAHIINVASCAGFLTFPWSSSYSAAKAGVLAYSECLANELADSSVKVTIACPGFYPSRLIESADCSDPVVERCVRRVFERSELTIDEVADAILEGTFRGRLHVLVPFRVRCWWWYKRFLPAQMMRSVRRTARRLRNRYAGEAVTPSRGR